MPATTCLKFRKCTTTEIHAIFSDSDSLIHSATILLGRSPWNTLCGGIIALLGHDIWEYHRRNNGGQWVKLNQTASSLRH